MNEKTHASLLGHLAQLNFYLQGDPESASLIRKLQNRFEMLVMGKVDIQTLLSNPPTFAENVTLEDLIEMMKGSIMSLAAAKDERNARKAEYIEQIDAHWSYVKALEERCHALTEEFKNNGGDPTRYPSIPPP